MLKFQVVKFVRNRTPPAPASVFSEWSGTISAKRFDSGMREDFWNGSGGWGFAAREQQLRSRLACNAYFTGDEGWACRERLTSLGQQLWREGEGSGLGAGEDPAGTTTAARDGMPVHAWTRGLTDHARSETIRTTPMDRLLVIAVESLRLGPASRCDCYHMGTNFFETA